MGHMILDQIRNLATVPAHPVGIEPTHPALQTGALPTELRVQFNVGFPTQPVNHNRF